MDRTLPAITPPMASPVAEYRARTASSERLHGRARRLISDGVSRQTLDYEPHPFYGRSACGQWIVDVDGNRYLDFVNNYTSLIHGHAHGPTIDAVTAVLRGGPPLGAPTELEGRLGSV